MKNEGKKPKLFWIISVLFLTVGLYNSLYINHESSITSSDLKKFKRLDEMLGEVVIARKIASEATPLKPIVQAPKFEKVIPDEVDVKPTSAIEGELNLKMRSIQAPINSNVKVEIPNGVLVAKNGIIEVLSFDLSEDEKILIEGAIITGNVFSYNYNGEVLDGMIYQEQGSVYHIRFTNGPLAGIKASFIPAE